MATARQEATRNGTWRLEEAKARLSEVVRRAGSEGPQRVTVRGRPAAVVLSAEEYERLSGPAGASPTCSPTCAAAASPTSCRSATRTPAGTSSSPSEPLPAAVAAWLLDTNVVTEILKAAPDAAVLRALGTRPESAGWISVLTLAEFAQASTGSRRPTRAAPPSRRGWPRSRAASPAAPCRSTPPWRSARPPRGALTRAGRRPPVIDALLAATAIEHGMTLVTRNVRDVAATGARLLDPWREGPHRRSASEGTATAEITRAVASDDVDMA
jgi:prevent-host-death family protein